MLASITLTCFILFALSNHDSFFVDAAYCNGSPDEGERTNEFPIYDGDLTVTRTGKNAALYSAGPSNATFPVLHLWGTPYELGVAQGTLMKKEVTEFVTKLWAYLITELVAGLPGLSKLPESAIVKITEMGVERALDWTAEVTAPFTPQSFFDELRGLSDATGIDYQLLLRINMFPELTKAQCSFFGAWGTAVEKDNHAYQLRALDFDTDGPFKDYHQIAVYHPDNGNAYAQVSWPGNVGILTGFSQKQIAVSEIGVSYPDDSFGQGTPDTPPEIVKGEPWMLILRDILQFESSLDEAKARIAEANRTCNLIIGLGDGKIGNDVAVNGVEFSGRVCNFYDDKTLLPVNETWHKKIEDVVYNGMDWLCPGYNEKMYEQLAKYHGGIEENVVVHDVLPTVQTGNLHIAVYDLTDSNMHVSFCRKSTADPSEPEFAYERQFTRLHMQDLFGLTKPQ